MSDFDKHRLSQLRNYAEWERNNREGPVGKLHILDWAATEIEALRAKVAELEAGSEVVEPVAKVEVWNQGGSGEFTTVKGIEKLPHGTKLYTKVAQEKQQ